MPQQTDKLVDKKKKMEFIGWERRKKLPDGIFLCAHIRRMEAILCRFSHNTCRCHIDIRAIEAYGLKLF